MFFDFRSTFTVECPIMEIRSNGRPPNFQAVYLNTRIVQVNHVFGNHPIDNIGMGLLQEKVMVASYENLMLELQVAEPVQEILDFDRMPPFADITRMDYHIALGQFQFAVLAVC